MRRVYDDRRFDDVSKQIMDAIMRVPADEVSEYRYGCYRASTSKIKDYIGNIVDVKFGKNEHAHGIGNNNSIELIVDAGDEEQICGLLHMTDDMFGKVICWVTDIDGGRHSKTLYVHGCGSEDSAYRLEKTRYERGEYWGK